MCTYDEAYDRKSTMLSENFVAGPANLAVSGRRRKFFSQGDSLRLFFRWTSEFGHEGTLDEIAYIVDNLAGFLP